MDNQRHMIACVLLLGVISLAGGLYVYFNPGEVVGARNGLGFLNPFASRLGPFLSEEEAYRYRSRGARYGASFLIVLGVLAIIASLQ